MESEDENIVLLNEIIIMFVVLLKECLIFCRILVGWLYGNENDRDGKISRLKDE